MQISKDRKVLKDSFLQRQSDKTIPIIIIFLEDVSHPLQANATLHKEVKTDSSFTPLIICSEENLNELGTQSVSKSHQRIGIFVNLDISTFISVESIEEGAPCRQKSPEATELFETDCTRAVRVEHSDHHLDSLRIE